MIERDPLDADVRAALDEANALANRRTDEKYSWLFTSEATTLNWRILVHVGERLAEYKKARIRLRRAIRGLRRSVREISASAPKLSNIRFPEK